MAFTTLLIDLDETVYPSACGVWEAISGRMERYMNERLGLPFDAIRPLRVSLYQTYGTTLRGLQIKYTVDERDFIDFVHDVPLHQLLQPDPGLRDVLLRYPQRKIIFTNADKKHASRVIARLGLDSCFDGAIDIYDIAPYCKPMPEAFQIALHLAGEEAPGSCVFIDDSPRNLAAAAAIGMYTIQVGSPKAGLAHPQSSANAIIERLHDLPSVLDPSLHS